MDQTKTMSGAMKLAYEHEKKLDNVLDGNGKVLSDEVAYDGTGTEFLSQCTNVFQALNILDGNLRQVSIVSALPVQGDANVIYYLSTENKMYKWNGTVFIPITSDIRLGTGANEAYPGTSGAALEQRMNTGDVTVTVSGTSASLQDAIDQGLFRGEPGERGPQGETGATGPQGPQGPQGETGPAWRISATFPSTESMAESTSVAVGGYCIIDTGNQEDTEYGYVYMRNAAGTGIDKWTFIIDMSVAGVQGPQGPQGIQGPQGPQGVSGTVEYRMTSDPLTTYELVENRDITYTTDLDRNPVVRIPTSLTYGVSGLNFSTPASEDKYILFSNLTGAPMLAIVNGAPRDFTSTSGYISLMVRKNKIIRTVFFIYPDLIQIEVREMDKPS